MICKYYQTSTHTCELNVPGHSSNGDKIQIGEKFCSKCDKKSEIVDCKSWVDIGHPNGGNCSVSNMNISTGTCEYCLKNNLLGKHLLTSKSTKEPIRGLGDVIAKVATPIARVLNLPCVDKETKQLRQGSPCAKRKEALNQKVPFN